MVEKVTFGHLRSSVTGGVRIATSGIESPESCFATLRLLRTSISASDMDDDELLSRWRSVNTRQPILM